MDLSTISLLLNTYLIPLIVLFGTIGNILSILIFTRPSLRRSCSIYFLASSINGLAILLFAAILRWLSDGFLGINPTTTSLIFCRLRLYSGFVIYNIASSLTACITIDRYCSSCPNAIIRRFSSRINLAYIVVLTVILITSLAYSHMLFKVTIINFICRLEPGFYAQFLPFFTTGYYFCPIILILVFGLGTIYNIRSQRRRIQPITMLERRTLRGDTQLLLLLLVHVICYISLALPYHISLVFGAIYPTLTVTETFRFAQNLTLAALNLSQAINFYVFTLTASLYRKELVKLLQRMKTKYWTNPKNQRFPNGITL
ncbi:hypothetical protein I4U23_027777 [Adineta vaga]|nr:hypothetical protein I4U23_027777 [Adineta vaga]